MSRERRWRLATLVVAMLGVAGLVVAYLLIRPERVVRTEQYAAPVASQDDLSQAAQLRVFFAHQSVGFNLLDAMPALYQDAGLAPPVIVESAEALTGPRIQHVVIGENGDPLGKLAEFDALLRGGIADTIDVAVFKFCYVDFHEGDDVVPVFEAYRDTMAALEADYPDVTFVYATVPLTTERGPLGRLKGRLGRGDRLGPEHNVVRQELNALILAEYGSSGRLLDLAALQSTDASGNRAVRSYEGQEYYSMVTAWSSDPGHLNPTGAAMAASAFLATLVDVG